MSKVAPGGTAFVPLLDERRNRFATPPAFVKQWCKKGGFIESGDQSRALGIVGMGIR